MKRMWRRFRNWARWTWNTFRDDFAGLFRGSGLSLRSARRRIRHAIPFLNKKKSSAPRSVQPSGLIKNRFGGMRRNLRHFRKSLPGLVRFYWIQVRQSLRPKNLARTIRSLPKTTYRVARGLCLLSIRLAKSSWRGHRHWLRHRHGYSFYRGLPALLAAGLMIWALLLPYLPRPQPRSLCRSHGYGPSAAATWKTPSLQVERLARHQGNAVLSSGLWPHFVCAR